MNLKNDNAKQDLCLAYSQGNITAYPPTIKTMARYLSTQYPNKNSAHHRKGKKGDRNRKNGDDPKSKTRTAIPQALQVHTLEILQHVLTFWKPLDSCLDQHVLQEIFYEHILLVIVFGVGLTQVMYQLTQQTAKKS